MGKSSLISGVFVLAFAGLVYYQWSSNKNKVKA